MGQPITWQNVNQGDVGTAWRGLETAGRSINGAFDGLQGLVKGAEAVQANNDVAIKNNNTQDYLNKLTSMFKSPEDLAAGLADGRVDQLKGAYGNAINHDQVRGAAEALLKTRQEQTIAGQTFSNATTDFKQQGTVDSIMAKLNSGDALQIAAGKAEFDAHPELRQKAAISQAANGAGYQLVTRDREGKKFTDDMLTSKTNREVAVKNADSTRMQAVASQESAHAATTNAATGRASLAATLQAQAEERQMKAALGLGSLTSHLLGSTEGGAEVTKVIQGIKDDDARAAAARVVAKLPADAKAADVTNLVQSIIKPGFWGTLGGKNTSDDEVLKSFEPVYLKSKDTNEQKKLMESRKDIYNNAGARAIEDSNAARDMLRASLPGYNPGTFAVGKPAGLPAAAPGAPAAAAPAVVPTPAAPVVTPAAAQEAVLRAAIPAPGQAGPRVLPPGADSFFGSTLNPSTSASINPVLARQLQANVAMEAAKVKAAQAAGDKAKAAAAASRLKMIQQQILGLTPQDLASE